MRPEEIEFAEDLPVRAAVLNITEYPYHWHSAVEIVYMLQGQIKLVMGGETHTLAEQQIAVVNVEEPHRISGCGENTALLLQIDAAYCQRLNPDFQYAILYCCSAYHEAEAPEKYADLKAHVVWLAGLLRTAPYEKREADITACARELLHRLTGGFDFLKFGTGTTPFEEKQAKRFRLMYEHILTHPDKAQGLREYADMLGITSSHLSYDIKRKFGMSFLELVYYGKCGHAARLLLGTGLFIPKIASMCGFSDPKYLIKYFKRYYHHTPSDFRKAFKADGRGSCRTGI